jgi:hypothetical protein
VNFSIDAILTADSENSSDKWIIIRLYVGLISGFAFIYINDTILRINKSIRFPTAIVVIADAISFELSLFPITVLIYRTVANATMKNTITMMPKNMLDIPDILFYRVRNLAQELLLFNCPIPSAT